MFEEMNRELEELKHGMNKSNSIDAMLNNLHKQLKELENINEILQNELDKEESEAERFGKTNLTTIFYTVLGSREKQAEKERQEALAARLKLDDNLKQIEDTRYQIAKLQEERKQYQNNEFLYNQLYKKKYNLMKESTNREYQKIIEIEDSISLYKYNLKEIKEAITAGNRVLDCIARAESSLNSAEGWGTWDLLGGGLITDMMKHSHIDDAKDAVSEIQSLLNRFRTELADIKINSEIHIQIDGFAKFADFFFDGLISDWVIQSRIKDSLNSTQRVKGEVINVIRKLEQMESGMNNELTAKTKELSDLIETA